MVLSEGGRCKGIIPIRVKTGVDKKSRGRSDGDPPSKKLLPRKSGTAWAEASEEGAAWPAVSNDPSSKTSDR